MTVYCVWRGGWKLCFCQGRCGGAIWPTLGLVAPVFELDDTTLLAFRLDIMKFDTDVQIINYEKSSLETALQKLRLMNNKLFEAVPGDADSEI